MASAATPNRPLARARTGWPVPLLLEEARLRSRRKLVGALVQHEVWPDATRHRRYVDAQHRLGQRLRNGPIRKAVGEECFSILGSRATFGEANRRVAARVPAVLALGHELGACLHMLSSGDEATARRIGERCALLNLGISIVDVICDNLPDIASRLGELLDENRLRALGKEDIAAAQLRYDAAGLEQRELRLLLTIVAAFFSFELKDDRSSAEEDGLVSLLVRAYRAEMRSVSPATLMCGEALAVAREKATLPFVVIGEIARDPASPAGQRLPMDRLVEDIAVTFWLTDDVVDLASDVRSGALNALLVDPDVGRSEALAELLDGGLLDDAAGQVGARLSDALRVLQEPEIDQVVARRLGDVLVCGVRDWLE